MAYNYDSKLRKERLPTQWCPGCGNGIVLNAIIRAMDTMGWKKEDVCLVSGIGCSGRMSSYMDCFTFHSTHGRPVAYATGIKFAEPEKPVIVVSGDGDGLAIGLSHFLHGCRRNIDLKYIIINNFIYGLTNSQASPTTPLGMRAVTQPFGNIENTFDACDLAIAAKATFVARSTTLDLLRLEKVLTAAFQHKGFSFVEILSGCPVNFGRKNDMGAPKEMDDWIGSIGVPSARWQTLSEEEKEGKFPVGILKQTAGAKEYCEKYSEHVKKIREEDHGTGIFCETIAPEDQENEECDSVKRQFRFTGVGGQGIISAGEILCEAMIRSGLHSATSLAMNSQVRGGPTSRDVLCDKKEINYPYAINGEIEFMLSVADSSYQIYKKGVTPGGIIVIDPNLVHASSDDRKTWKILEIPIVEIAKKEIGNIAAQSSIALGIAVSITKCVKEEILLQSITEMVPKKSIPANIKAFKLGIEYAERVLKE